MSTTPTTSGASTSIRSGPRRRQQIYDHAQTVLGAVSAVGDFVDVPGLKLATSLAQQILNIAQKVELNNDDTADLVKRIVEHIDTIDNHMKGIQGGTATQANPVFNTKLQSFTTVLKEIRDSLDAMSSRSWLKRSINSAKHGRELKGHQETLKRAYDNLMLDNMIHVRRQLDSLATAQTPSTPLLSITTTSVLPPAPTIFGRENDITKVIEFITSPSPPSSSTPGPSRHFALLGTGGIGKTSIALRIAHDHRVKSHFGESRYFVACDSIASATMLATSILQIMGQSLEGDSVAKLKSTLAGTSPLLLILDNFETIFYTLGSAKREIESLLRHFEALPNISLLITMRGDQSPLTASEYACELFIWSLSPEDARAAFLNKLRSPHSEPELDGLDELLKAVDYYPLAITLLAAQMAHAHTCKRLLERYLLENAAMFDTLEDDKLKNLHTSIRLSINSIPMQASSDSKRLLAVLSQLPDGIHNYYDILLDIVPQSSQSEIHLAANALLSVGLAYTSNGDLKMLAPIRDYCRSTILGYGSDIGRMREYVFSYIEQALDPDHPHFKTCLDHFNVWKENIGYQLEILLREDTSDQWYSTIKDYTDTMYWIVPTTSLLEEILPLVPRSHPLHFDLHLRMIRAMKSQNHYSDALEEAQDLLSTYHYHRRTRWIRTKVRIRQVAQILQYIGEILHMQGCYSEATDTLSNARAQFESIRNRLGSAQCQQSIGDILYLRGSYPEATDALSDARAQFESIGHRLGSAQCQQSIGDILYSQGNYPKATDTLSKAHAQFESIGNRLGSAQCQRSIGDILCLQGNYPEAADALSDARTQFENIGDRLGSAECQRSIGDILRGQGRYSEALEALSGAQEVFESIGSKLSMAHGLRSFGLLYKAQDQYNEAIQKFLEAKDLYESIGVAYDAEWCVRRIEEVEELLRE